MAFPRRCSIRSCGALLSGDANDVKLIYYKNFNRKSSTLAIICMVCWEEMIKVLDKIMDIRNIEDIKFRGSIYYEREN